jgi:CelD/BcsL family acetyltransferase involved in cellulose biosynthesis
MSPGTLLSAAMFRHAIDTDKVQSISYGTGDDGYKRDWMDQRDQLHILEFFNPLSVTGLFGMAKSAASRAFNALKTRKKT